MEKLNEKQVLQKLGLDNYSNLTRQKQLELVELFSLMDVNDIVKAIKQCPELIDATVEVCSNQEFLNIISDENTKSSLRSELDKAITHLNVYRKKGSLIGEDF